MGKRYDPWRGSGAGPREEENKESTGRRGWV